MESILEPGTLIGGQFEIVELAGRGSAGDVYLVKHKASGEKYAMKVLTHEKAEADPCLVAHYHIEAAVGTKVTSPEIVRTIGCAEDKPYRIYYLVMEYVEGMSLADYITTTPHITIEKSLSIIRECAKALSVLSQAGIVHRDVKPENIIMTPDDKLKLADFGIALVPGCADPGQAKDDDGKMVSLVIGTPAYSAPEQCADSHSATPLSDIYSLGVCLYQLLTGVLPFPDCDDPYATIDHVLKDVPCKPSEKNPVLPGMVDDLVMDMISRDPSKRPQNADEVIRWIDNILWELPKISIPHHKKKHAVIEEDANPEEDLFAPDTQEARKSRKRLIAGIAVLVLIIAFFASDSVFHFSRKWRLRKKNMQAPAAATVTAPAPVPEKKSETRKELPPGTWNGLSAEETLERVKKRTVFRFDCGGKTLSAILQELQDQTGLPFRNELKSADPAVTGTLKEMSLYDVLSHISGQIPDADFQVNAGYIRFFSKSAEAKRKAEADAKLRAEEEKKRKADEYASKVRKARTDGVRIISEAEKLMRKLRRNISSLEQALKEKTESENTLPAAEKQVKNVEQMGVQAEKISKSVQETVNLIHEAQDDPSLAGLKKKADALSSELPNLKSRINKLRQAAKEAKEQIVREKEKREKEEAESKAQEAAREKQEREKASRTQVKTEPEHKEEPQKSTPGLSREQQEKLLRTRYEKAKIALNDAKLKKESAERLLSDAEKQRRRLERENAKYPLKGIRARLEKEKKALADAEQKQKLAEQTVAGTEQKLRNTRSMTRSEIRKQEQLRATAKKEILNTLQKIKGIRLRIAEAQRLEGILQEIEKAQREEENFRKQHDESGKAMLQAEKELESSETEWFEFLYQVKGRNFVKFASAPAPWTNETSGKTVLHMKEMMAIRIRLLGIPLKQAMEIVGKASGLKITVSPQAETLIITADLENTSLADFFEQLCSGKGLCPGMKDGYSLRYEPDADGTVALTLERVR